MKTTNRRESPRIDIKLRCHVTSPAFWARTSVYTHNLSRSGILLEWQGDTEPMGPPAAGQILTLEIELPANHVFGQKCIHSQGTVLRVSPLDSGIFVALRVNYMDFRSFHDQLRSFHALQPAIASRMA